MNPSSKNFSQRHSGKNIIHKKKFAVEVFALAKERK